jgi:soluble lytic murein transglycosylase-like protein
MPTPPPPPPSSDARLLAAAEAAPVTPASAWTVERVELRLAGDPALAGRVVRLLPPGLARDVLDDVLARRELERLTPPQRRTAFRTGPAAPAARLRAWYGEAQRRSGVAWQLLAAVNFVESDFGRLREASVAGAQGPMQFMPSTWAEYGRGDVHDPHAAILGAARFLRAAGAPRDERGALRRYNPSSAYVDAVERLAGRIRRAPRVFRLFYLEPLVVRTPGGYARLP